MQNAQPSVFAREDTLLGVCEALGQDLGFNPLLLRLPLAVMLIWTPVAVIAAYLALGVLVLVSRLAFPNRVTASQKVESGSVARLSGQNDDALPLAAAA